MLYFPHPNISPRTFFFFFNRIANNIVSKKNVLNKKIVFQGQKMLKICFGHYLASRVTYQLIQSFFGGSGGWKAILKPDNKNISFKDGKHCNKLNCGSLENSLSLPQNLYIALKAFVEYTVSIVDSFFTQINLKLI